MRISRSDLAGRTQAVRQAAGSGLPISSGEREVPLHRRQPLDQVVGDAAQEEIRAAPRRNARRRCASRSARSKISVGPAMIAVLWLRRAVRQSRDWPRASRPAPDASRAAGACHSPEIPVYRRSDGRCRHGRTGSALLARLRQGGADIPASFARPRPAAALPRLCPPGGKRGDALCRPAGRRLRLIERPYCEQLGIPFAYDLGPGALSAEAIADPPPFERCRAVGAFDDVARKLVHGLKYRDRLELAAWMAGWMARAGGELLAEADMIVPVPLHRRRLWWRRFNQSAVLAGAIADGGRQAARRASC